MDEILKLIEEISEKHTNQGVPADVLLLYKKLSDKIKKMPSIKCSWCGDNVLFDYKKTNKLIPFTITERNSENIIEYNFCNNSCLLCFISAGWEDKETYEKNN